MSIIIIIIIIKPATSSSRDSARESNRIQSIQFNAGRARTARHTNAQADQVPINGEPESRRLREARRLLEEKQAAEAESWSFGHYECFQRVG